MSVASPSAPAVLITGTSSGIGRATALLLDKSGYRVFPTVRKTSDADSLRSEGGPLLHPLIMDVTDEVQIAAAVEEVRRVLGPDQGLACLVNNAGSAEGGPLELMAMSRVRRQFSTNVFGPIAVIQAFLPLLHQEKGRIVNVVSAITDCPMPFLGSYAGTKSAFLSMTMSLRRELRWHGIKVSAILPGFIKTKGWEEVDRTMAHVAVEDPQRRYLPVMKSLLGLVLQSAENGAQPESIAKAILKIIRARNPRAVYRSGPGSQMSWVGNWIPESFAHWVQEWYVRRQARIESPQQTPRLAVADHSAQPSESNGCVVAEARVN